MSFFKRLAIYKFISSYFRHWRSRSIDKLAKFLSSSAVSSPLRKRLLRELVAAEIEDQVGRAGRIEAEEDLAHILQRLASIAYQHHTKSGFTGRGLADLLEIGRRAQEADYQRFQSLIQRIASEQSRPGVVMQQAFSQEGEDLIVARILRKKSGFFIDVGAHHPTRFSNTYKLYLRGWRGINIDPLPGGMSLFDELRPEDTNLEIAISDRDAGATVRYYQFDEPAFNSLEAKNIADAESAGAKLLGHVDVPTCSLESIVRDYAHLFDTVDLLTIDVEHHELVTLNSFPFDVIQPSLVIVEIKGLDLQSPDDNPIFRCLTEKGYRLRSYLFHSAIFMRR